MVANGILESLSRFARKARQNTTLVEKFLHCLQNVTKHLIRCPEIVVNLTHLASDISL